MWAPELIYDQQIGKIMIYFTMRLGKGKTKLYYSYMNKEFNALESKPEILFDYPDPSVQVLDADITKLPGETQACEAPNVWKREGTERWVLMYDIFSIKPHNFGFAETTDFKHFTNLGHFDQGLMKRTNFSVQKHGAVIVVTEDEASTLDFYWKKRNKH